MNPTVTDEQLMSSAKSGDQTAFAELVDRLTDHIYGLSFRLLGNNQEAQDITQDTFIRMWESRHRWSPRAAVSTYAYRIAMNLCLNRLRSRKRWRLFSINPQPNESPPTIDLPIDTADSPESIIEQEDLKQHLESAISQLPPRERAAIILRHQKGLSLKEVAKVMDMTAFGVNSLLFRARKRLRELLSENK
jgi:RNA polymerase sigma-70 factor (ECF subfamily)